MTPAEVHRCAAEVALSADERAWQYSDVACGRCGVVVEVAKFSLQHTSVQWTAESVLMCEEFSGHVANGGSSALVASCASLRASINAAVADGSVEVLPP